jgi:hypothetical protein
VRRDFHSSSVFCTEYPIVLDRDAPPTADAAVGVPPPQPAATQSIRALLIAVRRLGSAVQLDELELMGRRCAWIRVRSPV